MLQLILNLAIQLWKSPCGLHMSLASRGNMQDRSFLRFTSGYDTRWRGIRVSSFLCFCFFFSIFVQGVDWIIVYVLRYSRALSARSWGPMVSVMALFVFGFVCFVVIVSSLKVAARRIDGEDAKQSW